MDSGEDYQSDAQDPSDGYTSNDLSSQNKNASGSHMYRRSESNGANSY